MYIKAEQDHCTLRIGESNNRFCISANAVKVGNTINCVYLIGTDTICTTGYSGSSISDIVEKEIKPTMVRLCKDVKAAMKQQNDAIDEFLFKLKE